MSRPAQTDAKRRELLPILAKAFADLGYRRATTAELARRCNVQENILYRLWPDKKAMFIAAIQYVYDLSADTWRKLAANTDTGQSVAERVLAYEATHHGEFGHYRIVFAGLNEADDPDIRAALAGMYKRYQRFIREQIATHRSDVDRNDLPDDSLTGWAIIGLGTLANISRALGLVGEQQRRRILGEMGRFLLSGGTT